MRAYRRLIILPVLFAMCLTGACARIQRAPIDAKNINDIVYAKAGNRELHLDLALPHDPSGKLHPAVIWIHGGGWEGGSYKMHPAAWLTKFGYVTGSIEYRLTGEAIYPAQIEDCKAAIRYLRAHAKEYGIDPDRIGVWGASAGGHLAALLGTTADVKQLEGNEGNPGVSSRVQAVVDYFGPTDLTIIPEFIAPAFRPVTALLGGTPGEKPKFDAEGKKTANARITVFQNGVLVQDNTEVPSPTPDHNAAEPKGPGPIELQNHGCAVHYRNIWG